MFDALSNSKPSRASVVLLLRCEKVVISLLSDEFHLKVTASDEASKIPDSLFIRKDINEFASCEERTKSSKNLKIVLFHYSQLDFRKCLKAPKTVQK